MSLGKKILSAFIEVEDEDKSAKSEQPSTPQTSTTSTYQQSSQESEKFKQYFQKLFQDSNLPGPDYFEFSKMIEAMQAIPDETQRYAAAFAGLSVQGMDKNKLLQSAKQYVQILEQDAANFNTTLQAAVDEKVHAKKEAVAAKSKRIEELSREISDLNNQMALLKAEIAENEEKIQSNAGGYNMELQKMKTHINLEIEKINKYL